MNDEKMMQVVVHIFNPRIPKLEASLVYKASLRLVKTPIQRGEERTGGEGKEGGEAEIQRQRDKGRDSERVCNFISGIHK